MTAKRDLIVLSCLFLALVAAPLAQAAKTPAPVPEAVLKNIDSAFQLTRKPRNRQEYISMLSKRMGQVVKLGLETEKKYAGASNLHLARVRMLAAADFLFRVRKSDDARKVRLAISQRVMASDAPPGSKVTADYFATLEKVAPPGGQIAKDADKQIRAYVQRYAKSVAEPASLIRGAQLAEEAALKALKGEMLDALDKKHAKEPTVNIFLRRAGRKPMFHADLTLVTGKKLTLPDGLLGKVVVIDFWATWCSPCIAAIPHMRRVYSNYNSRGVEFVGISLDRKNYKGKLIEFIKAKDLPWVHAYSGKSWTDPTARMYGIQAIPNIWVIGKDGRVFSDNARADLEGTIKRALAQNVPKNK